MGVRGLTTFIANRARQYLENYELHDTVVVIDGNCIACQLYKWHCKCNDCFGGDYDKYADKVKSLFQLLADCNITPLVIFDGAYERRKLRTVYSRLKNRISASKDLNSYTEGGLSVFPLFMRELFVDILLKLGVKCVRCDFECDSDAAYLARRLNCPIVSYDSDFYVMDVLYIPFNTLDLKLHKKKGNVSYIRCAIYRIDKFLKSFGGLDKINLPLLGVLLGNDYVKKGLFSPFYRQLKMPRSNENEQQRTIKALILWLKNETPDSAIRKILGRYKISFRRKIARQIRMAIRGYYGNNPDICSYFGFNPPELHQKCVEVPEPDDIDEMQDSDEEEGEVLTEGENSCNEDMDSVTEMEEAMPTPKSNKPIFFLEHFRKCLYPACFMEMVSTHSYYCIPQIEDFSLEHSHAISLDILAAIHKILTSPDTPDLICITRNADIGIAKIPIELYLKEVPKLENVGELSKSQAEQAFLDILGVQNQFCSSFPGSWHLYLISMKFWVKNSKTKISTIHIYSLVLCAIVLNYVDSQIGFHRSTKFFSSKFHGEAKPSNEPPKAKSIDEAIQELDRLNCVSCLEKLINYFQMDVKMRTTARNFNRKVIHEFAQFQSCLLHVKYLNALLGFPLPQFIVSDFYDGTFLYNMTTNLMKRTDLKGYMRILLGGSPQILNLFELMASEMDKECFEDGGVHVPAKRRRKKKKSKKVDSDDGAVVNPEPEEEFVIDPNNIFSMLSVV